LVKDWQEVEDLQVDIYGETKKEIYFIEVKDWSYAFYNSPTENFLRQQEIYEQQISRQERIIENFDSAKKIVYLISFPTGELAHDFQKFLARKERLSDLILVHHDQVHSKTWLAEYNSQRIDKLILERSKNKIS
jgi:hypothetical protein